MRGPVAEGLVTFTAYGSRQRACTGRRFADAGHDTGSRNHAIPHDSAVGSGHACWRVASPVTPWQQESLAGRRRHGGAGSRLLAAFRLGVVVRRSQPADGLLPADAELDPWGAERGVAAAAVGAVRNRIGPAVVCGGAKIRARWTGAGIGGAAGLQSGARVLLAGSPQLYPGDSAGAAVFLLLCAGGGRGPAARLGAVDRRQPACVLQSRFRRAGAGGAGVLAAAPRDVAGDLATSDFLRAADSGGGTSRADPYLCISRLT